MRPRRKGGGLTSQQLPQLRDLEDRGSGPGSRGFRGPSRRPRAAPAAPPERDRAAAGGGCDADRPLRSRQEPVRRGTVRRLCLRFAGHPGAVPRRRGRPLPAVALGVAVHRRGLVLAGEYVRPRRGGQRTDLGKSSTTPGKARPGRAWSTAATGRYGVECMWPRPAGRRTDLVENSSTTTLSEGSSRPCP